MKTFGVFLIIFGVLLIVFPKIIAYLIGGLLIIFGIILFSISKIFSKKSGKGKEDYVKFGNYKIYR